MARSSGANYQEDETGGRGCRRCLICLLLLLVVGGVVAAVVVTQVLDEDDVKELTGGRLGGNGETDAPAASTPAPTAAPSAAPTPIGFQACNGLESLCDVRVNQVLFATLHNAMSTEEDGVTISANHELQLEKALLAGWRGLNLDIGKCERFANTNNGVRFAHSNCLLGSRDPVEVFTNIQNFLNSRPNEVLLMPVQIDNTLDGGSVTLQGIYTTMRLVPGFTDLLYEHPGPGTPWPTLRQLIAANTRILFFHYNGEQCIGNPDCPSPKLHDWFSYAAETRFEFNAITDIENTAISCSLDRGKDSERDFYGINLFTRTPSSCDDLNEVEFVRSHLEACASLQQPNLSGPSALLVDCWNVGDVLSVVRDYNAQLVPIRSVRQANVVMQLNGLSSLRIMNDAEVSDFVSSCSNYFAERLSSDLTNVYCRVQNQSLVEVPGPQRRRQNRALQTSSSLQLTVQVSGDDAAETGTFSSDDLTTILTSSGAQFVQSLSQSNEFFGSLESISVATAAPTLQPAPQKTNAPTLSATTAIPTLAPTTSDPKTQTPTTTAPTMRPTESPVETDSPTVSPTIPAKDTMPPTRQPATAPTRQPTRQPTIPPTRQPTVVPTKQPAKQQTAAPTSFPTRQPTFAPTASPVSLPTARRCNGLENLCDLPVNEILFATVHNAMSTVEDGTTFAANHDKSLEKALDAGYRGINLDLGICDGAIQLVHAICFLGYRDPIQALTNIVSFLDANPNEVLIMPTQIDYETGGSFTLEEIDAMMQQVPGWHDLLYNHDPALPWPTLAELIDNNTRILFFHYNGQRCIGDDAANCPPGLMDWFYYAGESQFEFADASLFDDKAYACEITRGEDQRLDFYGVNLFTTLQSGACNTLNGRSVLETHIEECALITGESVNLVLVDCWDKGDVLEVVAEYNSRLL